MKKIKYIFITILLFLINSIYVYAASASVSINGSSSINVGDETSYKVVVSNLSEIDTGVTALQGIVKFDTNYFSFVSSSPMTSPVSVQENNVGNGTYNLVGASMGTGFNTTSTIYTIKLKAIKAGSGIISASDFYITDLGANLINCSNSKKAITIQEKVVSETSSDSSSDQTSSNNSNSSSNNNNNNTSSNYITSTKSSNNATSSNKNANNNLASLSVSNGELSPAFNAKTTNYKINVDSSVEKINVDAKADDSNAKVSINNKDNLTENGITNITIVVTAENGTKKTYTIEVTRGTLPDKVLSNDNYLTNLVPNVGILSPVFDKDITTYMVYLPYEVESIDFETKLNDSKNATLNIDKPDKLEVGSNEFKYTITAEDGSTRTYTIHVLRAINPLYANSSNNKLKDISVLDGILLFENGQKVNDFDGNIFRYYYTGKNPDFTAVSEDENAKVTMLKDGKDYEFIVEAPNGEYAVYIISPYKNMLLIYLSILILGIGLGYTIRYFLKRKKENLKKLRKELNNKRNK